MMKNVDNAHLPPRRRVSPALLTLLAPALLNAVFVVGDFIETPWAFVPAQISLELIGLIVLFALFARTSRARGAWWRWVLAAAIVMLLLLRLADIAVPWFFGRTFNAAVDIKFVPFFVGLLAGSLPPPMLAAYLAGAVVSMVLAIVVVRGLIGGLWHAVAGRRKAPFVAMALASLVAFGLVPARYDLGRAPISGAVAEAVWRNAGYWLEASGLNGRYLSVIRQVLAARPAGAGLSGFHGRNVLLIFAESYGAITLSDPAYRDALGGLRARFEARARATGYSIYSDVINSPITGGGSWMAHATVLTGIRIDTQPLYDVMLASNAPAIGHYFREAGYRTVAAMPRLQQPWPHGAFFSFDAVLDDEALGYKGARFSWETTPDQFVLERVHEREISGARQPLFVQYVLSSSHLPFDHVPPLIADGRMIGDGRVYESLDSTKYPAPGGQVFENRAGYLAAIRYVLESLENYLVERLADDSLVIILGDHQPPLTFAAATRNKAVPIHVLSRDPKLLEPFRRAGYASGLVPGRTETNVGMESFLPWLFENFGRTPHPGS